MTWDTNPGHESWDITPCRFTWGETPGYDHAPSGASDRQFPHYLPHPPSPSYITCKEKGGQDTMAKEFVLARMENVHDLNDVERGLLDPDQVRVVEAPYALTDKPRRCSWCRDASSNNSASNPTAADRCGPSRDRPPSRCGSAAVDDWGRGVMWTRRSLRRLPGVDRSSAAESAGLGLRCRVAGPTACRPTPPQVDVDRAGVAVRSLS